MRVCACVCLLRVPWIRLSTSLEQQGPGPPPGSSFPRKWGSGSLLPLLGLPAHGVSLLTGSFLLMGVSLLQEGRAGCMWSRVVALACEEAGRVLGRPSSPRVTG